MKKIFFLFFFILVTFFIVFNMQKKQLTYSFYNWKNSFSLKKQDNKLYIKVLDINYSNKLEVINTYFKTKPKDNLSIPVVYITNKAMKLAFLDELVENVLNNLKHLPFVYDEVQFDCDWSLMSKSKYFDFLKRIKASLNKKISATIRLHQIKYYYKTGVPPADYGLLMYYNMSNIADFDTKNSILDNDIAKKYHYNFDKYPLKLKLALPLYSQAIQFRQKKAIDIFEGVTKQDFLKNFKLIKSNYYEVTKSFYFKGRYIYKGDILRFEDSNLDDLKVALNDFFNISKNRFDEVVFYTIEYKNKYKIEKILKG
ncbi:hypothetical protein CPU12_13435 [Malaciobacter molluscorum LMG 25693]|uniref:Uncharacterized protein n=1 Tax=Malaciobacter molluscorum LMG 25693 TaxID=870501 RepID=A0A2G1DED8_9BACT|nr:hypothetical protein [Malaciobacter molluscorum]AXX93054.1 hypothetical protein AMOL_2100 [Malaciobacter molluscorum LMG 25693]PHO16869.1 hypothetical protein CPU12_13435 [Malaciobacter molluscorum LMG 25693]